MPVRPLTVRLNPDTSRLLRRYRGESPTTVLHRAMLLLAGADGHLTPDGKLRPERGVNR
ncbi:hypothetical protein ACFYPA_06350 [Streptomyces sp. NPDC005775]|uniref:hypothetical protein n=1 Tax=Streptomyces sp. NPDC005775 TaxID=3364729 RepID=UPI0036945475